MNGPNIVMDGQQPGCSNWVPAVPLNSPNDGSTNPSDYLQVTNGESNRQTSVITGVGRLPLSTRSGHEHLQVIPPQCSEMTQVVENFNDTSSSNSSTETLVAPTDSYPGGAQNAGVNATDMPTSEPITGQQMSSDYMTGGISGQAGQFNGEFPYPATGFHSVNGQYHMPQQDNCYVSHQQQPLYPNSTYIPSNNFRIGNISQPFNSYSEKDFSFFHDSSANSYPNDNMNHIPDGECGAKEIFSCLNTCVHELNMIFASGPKAYKFTSCLRPLYDIHKSITASEKKFNADLFYNDHNTHSNKFCSFPKQNVGQPPVNVEYTANAATVQPEDDIETVTILDDSGNTTPPPIDQNGVF